MTPHYHKCSFCENLFQSKNSLEVHIKSSKTCLKLRERNNVPIDDKKFYKCEHCDKELTSKHSLNNHDKICKIKINNELLELKNYVDVLTVMTLQMMKPNQ
jgi:hypothetical protein